MLEQLKREVFVANQLLARNRLSSFIWGNVSGIDRKHGLIVFKPSGMTISDLSPEDMVVVNLDGKRVEGKHLPSSDTLTHIELYRSFPKINGIAHSHARWSTILPRWGLGFRLLALPMPIIFMGRFHVREN